MRLEDDDRLLGAVATGRKAKLLAPIEGAGERELSTADFPAAHRGGKGHKVIKRGTPAGLRLPDPA